MRPAAPPFRFQTKLSSLASQQTASKPLLIKVPQPSGLRQKRRKRLLRPTQQTARFPRQAAQNLPSTRPGSNASGTFQILAEM
eukprot:930969-Prymnesium_polylepis.1